MMMITFHRERFPAETVLAASVELKSRNLSEDHIVKILNQIAAADQKDETDPREELGFLPKFFSFLLPGLLLFTYGRSLRSKGHYRKALAVKTWTLYGLGFYTLISVLLEILSIL